MMLSIFLVDDEPIIRKGLKKLIPWEQYGFRISGEAGNGQEALEAITSDNADIVIADLKMPVMNGLELCSRLKVNVPGIKYLVLTGYDDFEYMQMSIRNGVADYILKPVNAEMLLESLLKLKKEMEEERYGYPFDLESRLIEDLMSDDGRHAEQIVEELFDDLNKYKVPCSTCSKIAYGMLTALNLRLEQSGSSLKDIVRKDVLNADFFEGCTGNGQIKERFLSAILEVKEHRGGGSNKTTIHQIKEYIERHMHEDVSLNKLAKRFYLNPSYLSQLFKNETGETYSDYLTQIRMEKAKRLLGDANFKVQDVSELAGYSDSRYFSQTFKKYTGMSPSEYRSFTSQLPKNIPPNY